MVTGLAVLTLVAACCAARTVNITIDDTFGDERTHELPFYSNGWNPRGLEGVPCQPQCIARPDATQTYRGTWHDKSTYVQDAPSSVVLNFHGSKIYVFCILFNNIGTFNNNTRLSFFMDDSDTAVAQFFHASNLTEDHYLYDQLVFESASMTIGNHSLRISSWPDGQTGSLALFDYAIYTTEDSDATTTGTVNTGGQRPTLSAQGESPEDRADGQARAAIIGGSVGGGAVLLLFFGLAFGLFCQRKNRASGARDALGDSGDLSPFEGHAKRQSKTTVHRAKCAYSGGTEKRADRRVLNLDEVQGDEDAQLRSEVRWMREELERVRRLAEPPNYVPP